MEALGIPGKVQDIYMCVYIYIYIYVYICICMFVLRIALVVISSKQRQRTSLRTSCLVVFYCSESIYCLAVCCNSLFLVLSMITLRMIRKDQCTLSH